MLGIVFATATLVAPTLALADVGGDQLSQIRQLTTIVASLEAQEAALQGTPACAALFSKPVVHANEQVVLAWGSVGTTDLRSDPNAKWAPNGSSILALSKVGTWEYKFTFNGTQGGATTCAARIKVIAG